MARLIAHGALLVGYMSTASTQMATRSRADASVTGVSLGYDRMRFLAPVFFGDTITVDYTDRVDRQGEAARDRGYQDHQPGRRAGRGRDAFVEVGEEQVSVAYSAATLPWRGRVDASEASVGVG